MLCNISSTTVTVDNEHLTFFYSLNVNWLWLGGVMQCSTVSAFFTELLIEQGILC